MMTMDCGLDGLSDKQRLTVPKEGRQEIGFQHDRHGPLHRTGSSPLASRRELKHGEQHLTTACRRTAVAASEA